MGSTVSALTWSPPSGGDYDYDLIVIGAGSGGLFGAESAARIGARTLLVDRDQLGGDCTWTGCVPSKALLHASKVVKAARDAAELGVTTSGDVDMAKVREYVRTRQAKVYKHESPAELAAKGVDVVLGEAAFVDAHTIRVSPREEEHGAWYTKGEGKSGSGEGKVGDDEGKASDGGVAGAAVASASASASGAGDEASADRPTTDGSEARARVKKPRTFTATNFLVCTGATPFVPPIDGLRDIPFMTYNSIFDNDVLPKELIVMGGGPIGVEMAQAYRRLGSNVTLIDVKILAREAEDTREVLVKVLTERDGIKFVGGMVMRADREGDQYTITVNPNGGGEPVRVTGDALLVSTGRAANTASLNLAAAGVETNKRGAIPVDDNLMSNVPNVYAAGDVTGGWQFTHYAGWQAWIAVRNMLMPGSDVGVKTVVPWTTYCEPEAGNVGLTEEQAIVAHGAANVEVVRRSNAHNDRAVADADDLGFIKIVTLKADSTILGASVVGERAGELICEFAVCIYNDIKLDKLGMSMHAYPTYAFAVQQAASAYSMDRFMSGRGGGFVKGKWASANKGKTMSGRLADEIPE